MGKKIPAKQSASSGKRPEVSRKVLRGASAPYERKDEDGKGEKRGTTGGGDAAEAAAMTAGDSAGALGAGGAKAAAPDREGAQAAGDAEVADAPVAAAAAGEPGAGAKGGEVVAPAPSVVAGEGSARKPAAAAADQDPVAADQEPAAPGRDAAPAAEPPAEYVTLLPPRYIEPWDPESPAPAPGKAPPGDARSFRRYRDGVEEFALVYRHEGFLITRLGKVGVQGKWSVVEYPTIGMAAHNYAQTCSALTAEGYRDLR